METMKVRAIQLPGNAGELLAEPAQRSQRWRNLGCPRPGCGGGGGAACAAPASGNSQPAIGSDPARGQHAAVHGRRGSRARRRLYKGDERTPAGFDVEARPANVTGTLSTRHLKNTDVATGPQAISAIYEVCTNDMAQAIDWSERQATWQGQYSDIVEVRGDTRMFEMVRVPRADVTAMIRHRVFRCDYLDRSNTDLRVDVGAAGNMNQRPLTADELEKLAEYLWQFTMFNNSDYAVESSTRSVSGGGSCRPSAWDSWCAAGPAPATPCSSVDWTHTMNSADGTLTRTLSNVRSFQVKSVLIGRRRAARAS